MAQPSKHIYIKRNIIYLNMMKKKLTMLPCFEANGNFFLND